MRKEKPDEENEHQTNGCFVKVRKTRASFVRNQLNPTVKSRKSMRKDRLLSHVIQSNDKNVELPPMHQSESNDDEPNEFQVAGQFVFQV